MGRACAVPRSEPHGFPDRSPGPRRKRRRASYAHVREFEDVAGVVADIGVPVDLFGHSFGGPVALEGAILARDVRRVILYEPWLCEFSPQPAGMLDRFEAMARAGDDEGIMVSFLTDFAGYSEEQVQGLRAQPSWAARVEAAGLYGRREAHAESEYVLDRGRSSLNRPGAARRQRESVHVRAAVAAIDDALPDSRTWCLKAKAISRICWIPNCWRGRSSNS